MRYTIRVEGLLDAHWSPRLADLTIRHREDGTTVLTGPLADQAQLHGVLATLRDLNVVLLDLRATCSGPEPPERARVGAPLHENG